MASSTTSSSSSSKNKLPVLPAGFSSLRSVKQDKRWPSVDDYRYLAAGLLKQQMPKLVRAKTHHSNMVDANSVSVSRVEHNDVEKLKNAADIKNMKNLAKEMSRMLVNAKSKGQSNELLQLFKSTLTNFVIDKQQQGAGEEKESSVRMKGERQSACSKVMTTVTKKHQKTRAPPTAKPTYPPPAPPPPPPPTAKPPASMVKQHRKTVGSSEFTCQLSDRERSFITTTTTHLTRTKMRDNNPVISVIESSKTNVLHRCYGKQSVKAPPFVHKNSQKPIERQLQRPAVLKIKASIKPVKSQHTSVNQQMKTIYENGQFDKPSTPTEQPTTVCLPESDGAQNGPPTSEIANAKYKIKPKKMKTPQHSDEDSNEGFHGDSLTNEATFGCTEDVCSTLERACDPDSSLVHRLTSFWNKKLNTNGNEKSAGSDQSSIASSTTYIVNSASEMDLGAKDNLNSSNSKENVDQLTNEDSETKMIEMNSCKSGTVSGPKEKRKLPDIKMGLMDELITVLKGGNHLSPTKHVDRNDTSDQVGQVAMLEDKESDVATSTKHSNLSIATNNEFEPYSDGSHDSADEESSPEDVTLVDEYDECNNEDGDDFNDTDDIYGNECNDETIEAVQTCLMRRITVRNFNKRDTDENSENKGKQRIVATGCDRTYLASDNEIEESALIRGSCKQVQLRKGDEQDCTIVDKTHDGRKLKQCVSESHMSGCKASMHAKRSNSFFSKDQIRTTIINVNDIIHNLRNLIYEIETIPEELRTLNLDLRVLPLSDRIKETLSLILKENLLSRVCVQKSSGHNPSKHDGRAINLALLSNSIADKTIGYLTRESSLIVCYFASTFNMPIFENVVNPIEFILFPKRNDYFKCKTQQAQPLCALPYMPKELLSNVEGHRDAKRRDNDLCRSGSQESRESGNYDKYACMNRKAAKNHLPHFTLFYGTMTPKKMVSARACPSIVFQPYKKKTVTLKEDLIEKSNIASNDSTINMVQTASTESSIMKEGRQRAHGSKVTCKGHYNDKKGLDNGMANCSTNMASSGVSMQESSINFSEANLVNEINLNRHHSCGNTGKKRRLWRQPNIEDETCVPTGGAGDYGGVSSPLPCHRTSSMSVMVNSSVNDSNSQSDIHMMESDCRLRCLIGYPSTVFSRPQSETDNLSTNVIQEACEERMSDIDDCVMLEQHHKLVEGHSRPNSSHKLETDHEGKSSCSKTCVATHNKHVSTNNNEQSFIGFQLHQATSTTDLSQMPRLSSQDVGTMMSDSEMSVSRENKAPHGNNNDKDNNSDFGVASKSEYALNKDYIVLRCNTAKPNQMRRGVGFQRPTVNSKYNLDILFDNDPNLKHELSSIIDLHDLCDKEKQLIAICLMLLKRNSFSLNAKYQFHEWFHAVGEKASQLWNTSSQQLGTRMVGARKRLIIGYQSQTHVLITCQYKHMIKIVYTALVSLMLCFIIQKHFCGMSLPICFPW